MGHHGCKLAENFAGKLEWQPRAIALGGVQDNVLGLGAQEGRLRTGKSILSFPCSGRARSPLGRPCRLWASFCGTSGPDGLPQNRYGLIARVLREQFTLKSPLQNWLAQPFGLGHNCRDTITLGVLRQEPEFLTLRIVDPRNGAGAVLWAGSASGTIRMNPKPDSELS